MTVLIPTKLKNMVERYMMNSNRQHEMGGYFFGSKDVFKAFLPIPNHADSPTNTYSLGTQARHYADCYAKMIGEPIIADMHTHPNGTIPSEQDGKYVRGLNWLYHIVLVDKQTSFEWFIIDPQMRHISHANNDMEVEAYTEIVASEVGLTSLGHVYLTPKGEVVGRPEARKFLTIDQDVYRLEAWTKKRNSWQRWTLAEASRELGISTARVKAAKERMEASKK